MEIDVVGKVGAVQRQVAHREHDGQPARVVIASRTYPADVEEVWHALTDAERIPRWLMPVSGELRLGGRYQLEGNAGGEITACEPPGHLAVTWEYGGEVTWLDVRLTPDPAGGTTLRLEHEAPLDEERWTEYGPGAVGVGWDLALLGLDLHLATGAARGRVDGMAWATTGNGREFMSHSSDGWCRASVAGGTPEEEARAAADRTTAAYTGDGGDPAPE